MENEDYEYARRLKILSNGDFYEIERFLKDEEEKQEEKRSERIKSMRRAGEGYLSTGAYQNIIS